jgi:AcrR family transcriptional regulator
MNKIVPPKSISKSAAPKNAGKPVRKRLPTEERERQIVDGAIAFFSECGLNGQMRELATRIGVSHPLLFYYFPNKSALIQRVYQEVYLGRWKQQWESRIRDRSEPFEQRLVSVYVDYARTVLTKDWVRILVYSALADGYITNNYLALVGERMLRPIIGETRASLGLDDAAQPSEAENELLWGLHGGIFYIGVRHWIYGHPFPGDLAQIVADRISAYLLAAAEVFPREAARRA